MQIPQIENIHTRIYEACLGENALDMLDSGWHKDEQINNEGAHCGTTHCRGGWVVALAGKEGRTLELQTSTLFAAMQIYKASSPIHVPPTRFFDDNETALADMKRCAEEEKSLLANQLPTILQTP